MLNVVSALYNVQSGEQNVRIYHKFCGYVQQRGVWIKIDSLHNSHRLT